jgi:ribosomal protein L16 Arg81 hydroxylase
MTINENAHIFDQLIAPLPKQTFLSEFWGKSFTHIKGDGDRFKELVTWDEVNTVLEQHRFSRPRIRVFHDGEALDANRFMKDRFHLNSAGLTTCLAEGATLIIDSVHELFPAVGKLAEACQEILQSETTVNLYASWRMQKGFKLHWDGQDTMILQITGRKNWKVHKPTRLHPFKEDSEPTVEPTEAAIWDHVLDTGDVLYLPRGWWHEAYPLNEPSLHLTVTIVPANGPDLLKWFIKQLNKHPEVRMNLPTLASDAEKQAYIARLVELMSTFATPDLLSRFTNEWEASLPVKPLFAFPETPNTIQEEITRASFVRLSLSQGLVVTETSEESARYDASGVGGECAAIIVPALRKLSGLRFVAVSELISALPSAEAEPQLLTFLTMLATKGRLHVSPTTQ